MNSNLIFWPVLVQILITVLGFMLLGVRKTRAIKAGGVDGHTGGLNLNVGLSTSTLSPRGRGSYRDKMYERRLAVMGWVCARLLP